MSIHITAKEKAIVEGILKDLDYVYFGSRAKGTHQAFSDLDICIMNKDLSLAELAKLRQAFSESNIPIKVDIVVYSDLPPSFQQLISQEGIKA